MFAYVFCYCSFALFGGRFWGLEVFHRVADFIFTFPCLLQLHFRPDYLCTILEPFIWKTTKTYIGLSNFFVLIKIIIFIGWLRRRNIFNPQHKWWPASWQDKVLSYIYNRLKKYIIEGPGKIKFTKTCQVFTFLKFDIQIHKL